MLLRAHKIGLLLTLLIIIQGAFATGCANRVEINDRSFVLGVAIDKPKAPSETNKSQNQNSNNSNASDETAGGQGQSDGGFLRVEPPPKNQTPRYAMTIETPIIKQLGGGNGGGGSGGQGAKNKLVVTSTGNTIWDIERSLSIRIGRQDFYGHLKAIIIGEEVARQGIRPVIDFFTRRREVQQNIKLVIANGEARDALKVVPGEENFASFYVDAMLKSLYRSGSKINLDMLEIRRQLADSGNAVLPRIRTSSPTEIEVGGAAVLKDWKLIGWLSELETSGFNIVQNNLTGGSFTVVDPRGKSNKRPSLITVLVRTVKTKKNVQMVDHKPCFTIEVESEFDVVEKGAGASLWNIEYLHQIESLVEKEVQRRSIHIVDKMQREFKADVFGFGGMLSHKYPGYWKSIEKQWDEKIFPGAKVTVKANTKIRRTESKI